MPMSQPFKDRLFPGLENIAAHFGTPFHIYDETGMRETGRRMKEAFQEIDGFREYFAVKALPNPRILAIMADMGFGFDCSSIPEILLGRRAGGRSEDLMFTSNNTAAEEFLAALDGDGCIVNLDDITLIPKLPRMPRLISFRYNPGPKRTGNDIIGNPVEAKYGVGHEQIHDAYARAKERGATRFGIHTMLVSNELNHAYMVETARMLLELVASIGAHIERSFEFINIGGGFGIPYRPDEKELNIRTMGRDIAELFRLFSTRNGHAPRLFTECGRYMTGPHGVLVARAINRKDIYRTYIGVDACMSALMRPGMYGAYHHIDVPGKGLTCPTATVDVVGSLCENNDKFAVQRTLPRIDEGDLLVIHDTGAHGHAMGFNYNGKLRPKELLLKADGAVELIRREETVEDYFATLTFPENIYTP